MTHSLIPVIVTTEYRGVFFGYIEDPESAPEKLTLKDARCCIYWSHTVNGFTGLAAKGPDKHCEISDPVSSMTLYKITSISEISSGALVVWETWNKKNA